MQPVNKGWRGGNTVNEMISPRIAKLSSGGIIQLVSHHLWQRHHVYFTQAKMIAIKRSSNCDTIHRFAFSNGWKCAIDVGCGIVDVQGQMI